MPASTKVVMSNSNNSNNEKKIEASEEVRPGLRRRTVAAGGVDDEAANDWEAVSDSETSSMDAPPLTLMEQLVLLGLKDKQVHNQLYLCKGLFELYE